MDMMLVRFSLISSLFAALFVSVAHAADSVDITQLLRGSEFYQFTTSYGNRYLDRGFLSDAIDGNPNSNFQTDKGVSPGAGWFRYTISEQWNPAAVVIPTTYTLRFGQIYYPSSFVVYGSNVVSRTWDLLGRSEIQKGANGPVVVGEIDTSNCYRDFLIQIDQLNSPPYIYFNEFILEGMIVINENLAIEGWPSRCAEVTPSYGNHPLMTEGEELVASAPGAWTSEDGRMKAYCKGYTVSNIVSNVETGEARFEHVETSENLTYEYVHPEGKGRKLTWLWERHYRTSFRVRESEAGEVMGTVLATVNGEPITDGQYLQDGTEVHVEVVAGENYRFVGWSGVMSEEHRLDSSFTYIVNGGYSQAEAVFLRNGDLGLCRYVSESGDDNNEGLFAENAKKTVLAAYLAISNILENAGQESVRGEIRVLPGTNEMGDVPYLALDQPITIRGWKGSREECVIKANTAVNNRRHFIISSPEVVICDLTLSDGKTTQVSGNDSKASNVEDGGAIQMSAGMVTNCVIKDCESRYNGGGICLRGNPMTPPIVVDCLVTNCMGYRHGIRGLGIALTGGTDGDAEHPMAALVERTALINCRNVDTASYGYSVVWVNLDGGVVRDCVISGTKFHRDDFDYKGGGIYLSKGLAERCVITNMLRTSNSIGVKKGGGAYVAGGLLHNCLIANNEALNFGGGVYATGGVLLNNTVVDNECLNNVFGGLYTEGSGVVVANNILVQNQKGNDTAKRNLATSTKGSIGKLDYNDILPAEATSHEHISQEKVGTHNIFWQPMLKDSENHDYNLQPASPCVDAAATVGMLVDEGILSVATTNTLPFRNAQFLTDITGVEGMRPLQGIEASGEPIPDIGCYEAPDYTYAPLSCAFTATPMKALVEIPKERRDGTPAALEGIEELNVNCTFTATLIGGGTSSESLTDGSFAFEWSIFDAGGNLIEGKETTYVNTFEKELGIGVYSVHLKVTNLSEPTISASHREESIVKILQPSVYVNLEGANIPPYATWQTAAHYVDDAIGMLPVDIPLSEGRYTCHVTNGTYSVKGIQINILSGIDLVSENGAEETILEAHGANDPKVEPKASVRRIINLDHSDARVMGFTFQGAFVGGDSAGVGYLYKGVISDCIIRSNSTKRVSTSANGVAGIRMSGGRMERCIFERNDPGYARTHNSLHLQGGVVTDCVFTNSFIGNGWFGVVTVAGGVLTNCVIAGNAPTTSYGDIYGTLAAGLYQTGGMVVDCVIANNTTAQRSGANASGAYISGGTMRQCLIVGNTGVYEEGNRYTCRAAGIRVKGGVVENCTIVNNGIGANNVIGNAIETTGIQFRNNIVSGNGLTNIVFETEAIEGKVVNNCFYPDEIGDDEYGYGPLENLLRIPEANNWLENPRFENNYRLRPSSPCVNGAVFLPWMEGAKDLGGNRRVRGWGADIGCFEALRSNGTILFAR